MQFPNPQGNYYYFGYSDFWSDIPFRNNPYKQNTESFAFRQWRHGWIDAFHDYFYGHSF